MRNEDDFAVDEGKSAKFNAGVLQTQRINKILDLLNFCKNNSLAFNMDQNEWNFNLIIRSINSLYNEIDSFLKRKERKLCLEIKGKITDMFFKYPVVENIKKSGGNIEKKTNEDNWRIIEKGVNYYELVVRRYGVKYQVLAATIDEDLEGL